LLYLPNRATRPAPCFVGLNFCGNQATTADPAVRLSTQWMRGDQQGVVNERATDATRGVESHRWPFEMIIERGYAAATVYNGDIDPDYDHAFTLGVHPLFYRAGAPRRSDEGATITAWAWGLSRVLDYLLTVDRIDAKQVCVTGLSRLGKTALWAGATDERFALAVSNNSGCGGASLSRRNFGETMPSITAMKGHWFCTKCREHAPHVETLPVDQHMLVALMAPRPVFISSAEEDKWADPRGEFLSAVHASPVYHMLGAGGMDMGNPPEMPPLNEPILSCVGYYIRPGKHEMYPEDWKVHLAFADRQLGKM